MMKQTQPKLDILIFEIRYAYGNLYYDKCGQTLNDIEKQCVGWITSSADIQTGISECPDKEFRVAFSNTKFDFTAVRSDKHKIEIIAKEASSTWRLVQANLGVDEFLRIGCRLQYLLAVDSTKDAESILQKPELGIKIEDEFINSNYKVKSRQVTTILSRDDKEYRVKLAPIIRYKAVDPTILMNVDPRTMPKHQREIRIEQIKKLRQYSSDPMYAVQLDVDCIQFHPEAVSVDKYIIEQAQIARNDFFPILEKLCQH